MEDFLDFEKKIAELEGKIEELKHMDSDINISKEILKLHEKARTLLKKTYSHLTPIQKVQVARHSKRPKCLDYLTMFDDFIEISGDRHFSNDASIICGLGTFDGISVGIVGIEKGNTMQTRIERNFGMPRPEGYRKAQRLMQLASKFHLPTMCFIDTPGAYPGVDAEARGQAEAIAKGIQTCLQLEAPLISIIIGEGFSGGAIALSTADCILMLEHSVFSVISPEGCASILWKDAAQSPTAASALKLTAQDLIDFQVIDEIIPEPLGGAHREPLEAIKRVKESVSKHLTRLMQTDVSTIQQRRIEKYIGFETKACKQTYFSRLFA